MVGKIRELVEHVNRSRIKNNGMITVHAVHVSADETVVDMMYALRFTDGRGDFIDFSTLRIRNVYNGYIPTIYALEEVEDQMYGAVLDCLMDFCTYKYPKYRESGKLDDLYMNIREGK